MIQSSSSNNYDSSSRPSISQGGTPSSSSRTYRIPNELPQDDHRNFDVTNADKTAGTCWLDISKDIQNNNNSQSRPMHSSPQLSGGIMGSQNSGGSYRGFGSSPSWIYGSGSKVGVNGDYSNTENSPFAPSFSFSQERRSFKTFKSYNVSPMMDATSPGRELVNCICLFIYVFLMIRIMHLLSRCHFMTSGNIYFFSNCPYIWYLFFLLDILLLFVFLLIVFTCYICLRIFSVIAGFKRKQCIEGVGGTKAKTHQRTTFARYDAT